MVNPFLMSILIFLALGLLSWTLFRRLVPLLAMKPEVRWDRPLVRLARMLTFGLGQLRFFRRFELLNGIAHVLIFWGTIVVTINTIHVIGRGFAEHWSLPGFHGTSLGLFYAFVKDLFTLSIILGTLLALGIRLIRRPQRMILSLEANLILAWICTMMVLDVIYEGSLFMIHPGHPDQGAAFMGNLLAKWLEASGYTGQSTLTGSLYEVGFWGHIVMAFLFLNYLPYCKQFHEMTALPNIFFNSLKRKGELSKQDFEKEEILGVGRIEHHPWKRGLDMYTCAECGRCHANCPAHLTDKPLSPMHLMLDQRDHLKKKATLMRRAASRRLGKQPEEASKILNAWDGDLLTGQVVRDDVIWSCTTCGHCIENCPMLIEHVDHIMDMRRYLVQEESRFPKELAGVYKGWQNLSNPWSLASNARADWFKKLEVKTPEEEQNFEYLYYVGCAGSFDDRNRKVSSAVARLMNEAGVRFACLGNEEKCCGETARRLGNEFLAQKMMKANVDQWKELGVKRIVTGCAHCYNTIRNEYGQFGGEFEVIHHSELIQRLLREKKLNPTLSLNGNGPLVYHDPCYLGRYNDLYEAPREALSAIHGVTLTEHERSRRVSFCCGAGGGRMWMDDKIGTKINEMRCEQLEATDAKTFATACPYCLIMLDDAVKDRGLQDKIKVMDLAQIVDKSIG